MEDKSSTTCASGQPDQAGLLWDAVPPPACRSGSVVRIRCSASVRRSNDAVAWPVHNFSSVTPSNMRPPPAVHGRLAAAWPGTWQFGRRIWDRVMCPPGLVRPNPGSAIPVGGSRGVATPSELPYSPRLLDTAVEMAASLLCSAGCWRLLEPPHLRRSS
jgi:hypothetical protein